MYTYTTSMVEIHYLHIFTDRSDRCIYALVTTICLHTLVCRVRSPAAFLAVVFWFSEIERSSGSKQQILKTGQIFPDFNFKTGNVNLGPTPPFAHCRHLTVWVMLIWDPLSFWTDMTWELSNHTSLPKLHGETHEIWTVTRSCKI